MSETPFLTGQEVMKDILAKHMQANKTKELKHLIPDKRESTLHKKESCPSSALTTRDTKNIFGGIMRILREEIREIAETFHISEKMVIISIGTLLTTVTLITAGSIALLSQENGLTEKLKKERKIKNSKEGEMKNSTTHTSAKTLSTENHTAHSSQKKEEENDSSTPPPQEALLHIPINIKLDPKNKAQLQSAMEKMAQDIQTMNAQQQSRK